MSEDDFDFAEIDDYARERPRDVKIDEAKSFLREELFATNPDAVYYQRQIETKYESIFFHWITAKALNELAQEGNISSEVQPLVGNVNIRFYWDTRNRYWRRRAAAIRKLVLEFSNPVMGHALGRQGELMFDAALPRAGFLPTPPFRNVKEFNGRVWTESKHDLDRVVSRDGVDYGVEVKNTLSYIDKTELDIKLRLCAHLGLRPLFIMRMAPKSYVYQIAKAGGFTLIYDRQLYPYGQDELVSVLRRELELPIDCIKDVPDGHLQRLRNWHGSLISRLSQST